MLESKLTEQQPDFGQIFSQLRTEVARSIEITSGINYLGGVLKLYPPEVNTAEGKEQEHEQGIIPALWDEIYRLRSANNLAEYTMNHLKSIIGS